MIPQKSHPGPRAPAEAFSPGPAALGVLSVHLDGGRCRVGCPFCYLGRREGEPQSGLDLEVLDAALADLRYREVAFALSEPIAPALPILDRIVRGAGARGRPVAVTTTAQVIDALPAGALAGVGRLSLSIDPFKGPVSAAAVGQAAAAARLVAPAAEIVLIVTLSTHRFARELIAGQLAELIAIEAVDRVALNAVKPPPHWCDRRFWLAALSRLGPVLRDHLDRRLFLDCYVAARLLGLGGCPARPDLSPAPGGQAGVAFRSCVYQPAPDFVASDGAELARRLGGFVAPAVCPFPIE